MRVISTSGTRSVKVILREYALSNSYDTFVKTLLEKNTEPQDNQQCSDVNEKFLAHVYNAIKIAQKI